MRADDGRGQLDGMLMSALESGPLHGYAVIEAIQRRSGGEMKLPTGTVYPALNRLERDGMVKGASAVVGGRQRRTYTLTMAGRRALGEHRAAWRQFASTMSDILAPAPTAD